MAEYVITDGSRFIKRDFKGHFVPTSSETLADTYSKKQAEGILRNSLPKALRKIFRVEKHDIPPQDVKQVSQEIIKENTEKVALAPDIQRWVDKITSLNGLAEDIAKRKDELLHQLSQIDQELSDCIHYIEFCNLNAAQGYKAYKMIKERRVKRRSIKNELAVLNMISEKRIGENVAEEIQNQIHTLDNRQYRPRILTELFDL